MCYAYNGDRAHTHAHSGKPHGETFVTILCLSIYEHLFPTLRPATTPPSRRRFHSLLLPLLNVVGAKLKAVLIKI